ncbi:MAG: hypothetical protein ABI743_04820 [bacterium]
MTTGPATPFLPPPVTPERMSQGLTAENLATAVAVRSMPEERRLLEGRYRCFCGQTLFKTAEHMIEHEARHLHLLGFQCPQCMEQSGIIFDVTAVVALLPGGGGDENVSVDDERRAAELGAYLMLDKATSIHSEAALSTLINGIRALGMAAIGALRYSLRDISPGVAGVAAVCLAEIGNNTDVRRLAALQATNPTTPNLKKAIDRLNGRVAEQAREEEMVWRPTEV